MFYLVTKNTSYRRTDIDVLEFETEKEAVQEARKHPRNTVAVFSGERLALKKDKVRVIRKEVVGFETYNEDA